MATGPRQTLVLSLLVLALAAGPVSCGKPPTDTDLYPHSLPVQFVSETVQLYIAADSMRVEGTYHLSCTPPADGYITLFYPYPADSLCGPALTELVEYRTPDAAWQGLQYTEVPQRQGVQWRVPLGLGASLEIRTVYRQALLDNHARYIVTTTSAWGAPLQQARFEIYLPPGAMPVNFSFPFAKVSEDGGEFYLYEVENFLPDEDIIVTWKFP